MDKRIKKICFFSVGFAFNRLIRMKYYEKIFPKDVEIFLFTTKKYEGTNAKSYQSEWDLKRTEINCIDYNRLKLPFKFRYFCREKNIDRIINLGSPVAGILMLFATIFKKRDYELNILSDFLDGTRSTKRLIIKLRELLGLFLLYPLIFFAKRVMFTGKTNAKRAPTVFLSSKNKIKHLAAPVNVNLFKQKNKKKIRKRLKIPESKKIVIFVGRIGYSKCSDILKKLIELNPQINFIVIGRLLDKEFLKTDAKNLQYFEKKSSKELVDYYDASDLAFCLNRGGGGIGIATEEALACGVPVIVSKLFKLKKSPALFESSFSVEKCNEIIRKFFILPGKEKNKISKIAREYTIENYSDEVWKNKYLRYYLNL